MENPDFKLSYSVDDESVEEQVKKLALNVNRDPEDAKVSEFRPFSADRFTYQRGKNGYVLDKDDLTSRIIKFFSTKKKKAAIQAEVETVSSRHLCRGLAEQYSRTLNRFVGFKQHRRRNSQYGCRAQGVQRLCD